MRWQTITIFFLALLGFALRLYYLTTTHPFFDEYTTVLAAREILRRGWPVLPSGLFYEHGLLATYLIAPFTALFINTPVTAWQTGHWGLMLSRWPSLLISVTTIPLIYALGRRLSVATRQHVHAAALLAAGLFAFSPEGMVWGGRARMYALAVLLVLLAVYWAYRGALYPAPAKYRWLALLAVLAALLTQLAALTLIPPLVIAMVVIGWFSLPYHLRRITRASEVWFLRPSILWQGLALMGMVGLSLLVKRLGQPLGVPTLGSDESGPLAEAIINTVTYQTAFHLTWSDTVKFFAREFGVPHHGWLVVITLACAAAGLIINLFKWLKNKNNQISPPYSLLNASSFYALFLWLIFSLIILEMVVFLDPFRRNPRYIVMYLPLLYLIAAHAILNITTHFSRFTRLISFSPLFLLALFTALALPDLRLALNTPEPAYEEALAFVQTHWQPGDAVLTMNTSAAGLYLGRADGFTAQNNAAQFLLNADSSPVDRWLGVPWLGAAADLNTALNAHPRVWFVIDTIRLPVYFRGDWLALVNNQMEPVWAKDDALVYLTRPNRVPLPTRPATLLPNAILDDSVQLAGYTLTTGKADLQLILFWQPLTSLPADYTVFVHLRNQGGVMVAQRDAPPLDGAYPTSRWQPGETVIDPLALALPPNLPAGTYRLLAGMYRLDTLQRLPVAHDTSGENALELGEVNLP